MSEPTEDEPVIETDDFTLDVGGKRVFKNGTEIGLTPTEWGIVEVLVRHRGKLVTQTQLGYRFELPVESSR